MKNSKIIILITLISFFTFSSCRTVKQKTSTQESMIQKQYTETQSRQAAVSQWWDSTGRYWSFNSDSAFYYHPDSGLYAGSGTLSVSENKITLQTQNTVVDGVHTEATIEEKLSLWQTYYRRIKDSKWTVVLVMGLLLFGLLLLNRYRGKM